MPDLDLHLCYAYIHRYKVLNEIELTFDAHYRFQFYKERRVLHIETNEDLPDQFWGNGVYSLACLFGDNGSGKSTALSFLLDALVEGMNNTTEVNGLIVYEKGGKLYIYKNRKFEDVECEGIVPESKGLLYINTFYYSGHFLPYSSARDLRCFELAGNYNASDGWKLIKDAQDYMNIDSLHFTLPMWNHLNSFVVQNNYRICSLLADTELVEIFNEYKLPRIVLVSVNQSGVQAFKAEASQKQEDVNKYLPPQSTVTIRGVGILLESFIYHNMVNAMRDRYRYDNMKALLEEWQSSVSGESDVLVQFGAFVEKHEDNDDVQYLEWLLWMLKRLVELAHFDEDRIAFYFDVIDDKENFKIFVSEVLEKQAFIVNRCADLYFWHSLDREGESVLSSGEFQMLNLFSRLYDAVFVTPKRVINAHATPLLLLDEAETGFHPDWQRKYIHLLITFLSKIKPRLNFDFQIVLTSHSPILLSDIPGCCTNRFHVDENHKPYTLRNEEKETYASNIFDLYRDYFSLHDGLIGHYAENRILRIRDLIKRGQLSEEEVKECQKEIALIGDSRIRAYFDEKLARRDKKSALEYYRKQIEHLKQNEQD